MRRSPPFSTRFPRSTPTTSRRARRSKRSTGSSCWRRTRTEVGARGPTPHGAVPELPLLIGSVGFGARLPAHDRQTRGCRHYVVKRDDWGKILNHGRVSLFFESRERCD